MCTGQLADAVGDDLSRCTATSGWIEKEANVPSGLSCYVARAVLDQLAGSEICDSTGDKRGTWGIRHRQTWRQGSTLGKWWRRSMLRTRTPHRGVTLNQNQSVVLHQRPYTRHCANDSAHGGAGLYAGYAASSVWLRGAVGDVSSCSSSRYAGRIRMAGCDGQLQRDVLGWSDVLSEGNEV